MDRRKFLKTTLGTASVASLVPVSLSGTARGSQPRASWQGLDFHVHREYPGERGPKTMLFWDYWKVHHLDNVELVPGKPKWIREGTYHDPHRGGGGTGRVYFDEAVGKWRKLTAYNQFFISEMSVHEDNTFSKAQGLIQIVQALPSNHSLHDFLVEFVAEKIFYRTLATIIKGLPCNFPDCFFI